MPTPLRTGSPPARHRGLGLRHELLRLLVVLLAVVALLVTSSALDWVTGAQAADGPRKAVVVCGPVHASTDRYLRYARAIADAAEAEGMQVVRIFHPKATPSRVKKHASGAHLFVYAGHGNGWPSPFPPFQEDSKNGLGLNPAEPAKRTTSNVVYKGADWLRENIRLAPDAVVILSHLSYASGNGSSGMPIPSREEAIQRVDNYASGFLASGARVVWALGWQPGEDVVRALHREDATMDAVFMTRYREKVSPENGWLGHAAGHYPSVRVPGAMIHIDPSPGDGYLRAITGDLGFTTTQWRGGAAPPADLEPPIISEVSASQSAATLASTDDPAPVFTPNDDGISDSIAIGYRLSEAAFVELRVQRDGRVLRNTSVWSLEGPGSLAWDGRRDDGSYVGEGRFDVVLTPTDRAGNQGQPAGTSVKVLNSLKKPRANPSLFHPSDGDGLADTAALKARLTRKGSVSWTIRNGRGKVVRQVVDDARRPGDFRFVWDGTTDGGAMAPPGRYAARVRVTRPQGTYAHEVAVHLMPFKAWTKTWTLDRGGTLNLTLTSAEPLKGKPVVSANQRGIRKYGVPKRKIRRLSETSFRVAIRTRAAGKPGPMKVRVKGTDSGGGTQAQVFTIKLR